MGHIAWIFAPWIIIALIGALTVYKIWRINRKVSDREAALILREYHRSVKRALVKGSTRR